MSIITDALAKLWLTRQTFNEVEAEHKEAKETAVEAFQKAGQGKAEVIVEDRRITGTLVEGESLVLDEASLLEALTDEQRDAVTKVVLDKDKLEAAVKLGIVDEDTVTAHSELKPRQPYILVKDYALTTEQPRPIERATKKRPASKGAVRKQTPKKAAPRRRK